MAATDGQAKAAGSTLRMRRSLSRFFTYSVDQAFATVSPMRTSEMEPKDEGKLRVERTSLDLEQAQALLTHGPGNATTNPHHDRDAIALALMGVLGLRAGEIAGLDADHFTGATSSTSGFLQIYGKGRTWRTVPLPPWLEAVIVAYRARLGTSAPGSCRWRSTPTPSPPTRARNVLPSCTQPIPTSQRPGRPSGPRAAAVTGVSLRGSPGT